MPEKNRHQMCYKCFRSTTENFCYFTWGLCYAKLSPRFFLFPVSLCHGSDAPINCRPCVCRAPRPVNPLLEINGMLPLTHTLHPSLPLLFQQTNRQPLTVPGRQGMGLQFAHHPDSPAIYNKPVSVSSNNWSVDYPNHGSQICRFRLTACGASSPIPGCSCTFPRFGPRSLLKKSVTDLLSCFFSSQKKPNEIDCSIHRNNQFIITARNRDFLYEVHFPLQNYMETGW